MSTERIRHLLDRLQQAATDAHDMIHEVDETTFATSIVLQRAVGMCLLMASEIAVQLIKNHADFVAEHPEFPWEAMRGMRNRIAHGYFDIDLQKVWSTAKDDVPDLIEKLHALRHWRAQGE